MIDLEAQKLMYQGKKVAIVGYGLEGESAYKFFAKRGADITIVDEAEKTGRPLPDGVKTIMNADLSKDVVDFDYVSRTPPINPAKINTNGEITSVTKLFFDKCPGHIIGVTGTKGKGTTTTLISEILKSAGKRVHLVGNVGTPALDIIDDIEADDIVAYELSSFQLWDMEVSPETAVILMIKPDHLDIHSDIEEYVDAKAHIGKHQLPTDLLIYHPDNELSAKAAAQSPAQKKQYLTESAAHIRGGELVIDEQVICSVDDFALPGEHNHQNITAAVTAAWKYTQDVEAIASAIKSFDGLEHRLEFVRELDGVKYYNDSYASATIAVMAALRAFEEPKIILLGGKDKGVDYSEVAELARTTNVKKAILYGAIRDSLKDTFDANGFSEYEVVEGDITDVINAARASAEAGDLVLLSPGTASYDMFKNFKQRGEAFKKAVMELS